MRYANNLKALQAAKGLTIDQAAKAMGMSRGGYLKIQRGENRLTSTTIARAAQAFGVAESAVVSAGEPMSRAGAAAASDCFAVVEADGSTAIPAELRELWGLKPGDRIEFFQDHVGGWRVRPRNAGPLEFLDFLPPRPRLPDVLTDEAALAKSMAERNAPTSPKAET